VLAAPHAASVMAILALPPATIDVQGLADAEAVNLFRLPRNHSGSRFGGVAPARDALFIGRFRVSRSLELALADYGVAWIGCPSCRSGTTPFVVSGR
jgi:hypothetical protein